MARAIWKGQISFGLVNIPVSLYPAEKRSELHFKLLDKRTRSPVRYRRVNENTGEEVPWEEIAKGYELGEENYVILEEEDFKKVDVEASQTVEVEDFVDQEDIGYVFFDKPYYLVPGKKGEKGYVLMRETLRRLGKVGIARVVIRTRQYLAALIPEGNALVLELLRYEHELRDKGEFSFPSDDLEAHKITEREIEMAKQLVQTMTTDWDPKKYKDEYREELLGWIEKKAREGEVETPPAAAQRGERTGAEVIDMMTLLKKSVQQTAKERGKSGGGKPRPSRSRKGTSSDAGRSGGRAAGKRQG